jgi:hypothetical protein
MTNYQLQLAMAARDHQRLKPHIANLAKDQNLKFEV